MDIFSKYTFAVVMKSLTDKYHLMPIIGFSSTALGYGLGHGLGSRLPLRTTFLGTSLFIFYGAVLGNLLGDCIKHEHKQGGLLE